MPYPYSWKPSRLTPTAPSQVKVLDDAGKPALLSTAVAIAAGTISFQLTNTGRYHILVKVGTQKETATFTVDPTGVDVSDPEYGTFEPYSPADASTTVTPASGTPVTLADLGDPNSAARASLKASIDTATAAAVAAQVPPLVVSNLAASGVPAAAAAAAVSAEVASRDLVETADYMMESGVDTGWVDSEERLVFGIDVERGVTVAPVIESVDITATGSITAPTVNGVSKLDGVTNSGSGLIFGYVDQNELVWHPLAVDEDGRTPQFVIDDIASRMPPPTVGPSTKYRPVTHGNVPATEANIVSGPDVVFWGHSMLSQAGPSIASQLVGLTCRNGSVGGESSSAIMARQGATPLMLLPEGGAIPASGGVVIPTFPIESGGTTWPLLQGAGTDNGMTGTLAGVPGVITLARHAEAVQYVRDSRDVYTFTRTTPGAVVPVTRPAPFYYSYAQARRNDLAIFWVGRNNITAGDRAYNDLRRGIQHMVALEKRFIILGENNGATEPSGHATHTAVLAYNAKVQNEYGRRFIDVRRYLIDYGLEDEGIVPTTQDLADIAADVVPVSLRSDGLHLNAAGNRVIGKLAAARLRELGWVI